MFASISDKGNSLDCNAQIAKNILHNFISAIKIHDIETALSFLSTEFNWVSLSRIIDRSSMREFLTFQIYNSNKYKFIEDNIICKEISECLFTIFIPMSILELNQKKRIIISTVIVDSSKKVINSIALPLDSNQIDDDKYKVGGLKFRIDDNLSIISVDSEVAEFFSFLNEKDFIDVFKHGFINSIKVDNRKHLLDLLNRKKIENYSFITYIAIINKLGEFIDVVLEVCGFSVKDSVFEVEAVIHDSMSLYEMQMLNGKRFSRLINILNNSPTPFFFKNNEGVYLGCNSSYLKLLGVKDYFNTVGQTDYNFLSKEQADLFREEDLEVITSKKSITRCSKQWDFRNKEYRYYQYIKYPFVEGDKVVGIICFLTDVSVVKNLNQQLIKSQSEMDFIFNNSKLSYFFKDKDLRFTRVNETFLNMFPLKLENILGLTSEEFIMNMSNKFKKDYHRFFNYSSQELTLLKSKKPFALSIMKKEDNSNKIKYYSIVETPLLDDCKLVTGIVGSVEDITVTVERQIELESKYKNTMRLISDEDFISFLRLDLDQLEIVEFDSKIDIGLQQYSKLTNSSLQSFIKYMVYENEKEQAKKIFNIEYFRLNFSANGKFTCQYTFAPRDKKLSIITLDVSYNINPSNNHREVFISAIDITKTYQLNELVNSITKTGYDLIVKINGVINICEILIFDENKYSFGKLRNSFSLNEFMDIMFKDIKTSKPTNEYCIKHSKKLLATKDEIKYSFDTFDDRRKSLVIKVLNREKETYLLTLTDITDITMKDRALQQKLQKAAIQADNANKIKTEFLAKMSHDMRTPLNGIMGFADFGQDESRNNEIKEYFSKIKLSSNYLLTLLNDVLDMQSIEKGKIVIVPRVVDFIKLIKEVESIVNSSAKVKNIKLEIIYPNNCPLYILVDSIRVRQVFVNLLNNAIKYTGINGHVIYKTEYISSPIKKFRITISDNGVGMSKSFQKHMFESFTTENNKYSATEGGTGLGLAISKNLISLMNGSIKCESTLNVGTVFTIDLPFSSVKESDFIDQVKTEEPIDFHKFKGKKVLICEDNKINVMVLEKLLVNIDMIVDVAENGLIGIEKASNNNYDLIFMDIRMPFMNGLEAAINIRKYNKSVPIIALSANAYKEDIDKSLRVGINSHLSKPIEKNKLFKTINHYIK